MKEKSSKFFASPVLYSRKKAFWNKVCTCSAATIILRRSGVAVLLQDMLFQCTFTTASVFSSYFRQYQGMLRLDHVP